MQLKLANAAAVLACCFPRVDLLAYTLVARYARTTMPAKQQQQQQEQQQQHNV
jgi:hypothetical protein